MTVKLTSFEDKLVALNNALEKGELLTTELKVVHKGGLKWALLVIKNFFSRVLCCSKDPWAAFRINKVAEGLNSFFTANSEKLKNPEQLNTAQEILKKLEVKAQGSKSRQLYLQSINTCRDTLEKASAPLFAAKVTDIINHAESVPGCKSEELAALKPELLKVWGVLVKEGVYEVSATDKETRPVFVTLQAIIEHALVTGKGYILTPMPATPLCTKGEISRELVNPSIAIDPKRLFTVQARTTIVRDYLHKGGDLYVIYPKDGFNKRTEEQQNVYKQELAKYPEHLFDVQLNCESVPDELIGAVYTFFESGRQYVFAIKMTQAKNPKDPTEIGNFGLWYGSINNAQIKKRVDDVSTFIEQNSPNKLKIGSS